MLLLALNMAFPPAAPAAWLLIRAGGLRLPERIYT